MRRELLVLGAVLSVGMVHAQGVPGTPPSPPHGITPTSQVLPLPEAGKPGAPGLLPPLQGVSAMPAGAGLPGGKGAAQPAAENLLTFDPQLVNLQWLDNRWQLMAGGVVLKDFGRSEREGRDAARLLQLLHLNQVGRVGTPQPVMEYWLSDGHAPQGFVPGLHVLGIDQAGLRVEQMQGSWCVRDSSRILFNFGSHQDECQQAVDVIRRHGFARVGYLGNGQLQMLVFLASNDGLANTPNHLSNAHLAGPAPVQPALHSLARTAGIQPGPAFGAPSTGEGNDNRLPPGLPQPGMPAVTTVGVTNPTPPAAMLPHNLQAPMPGYQANEASSFTDRIPVDWHQVRVKMEGQEFKLMLGNYTIVNFGKAEREARQGLGAAQFYHFTEECLVGHPKPVFTYFLVNGQAPRGLMFGVEHVEFEPEEVALRQVGNDWVLTDGGRVLVNLGEHGEEGKEALKAIKRYKFDTLCHIGRADGATLTFPVKTR
jgi:hypothetical protein